MDSKSLAEAIDDEVSVYNQVCEEFESAKSTV
jgi:hypothetical protein